MRNALEAVAAGRLPEPSQIQRILVPMLAGTGEMWDTWEVAGGQAKRDLLREAPPVYLAGRIAGVLSFSRPILRGATAMVLSAVPLVISRSARSGLTATRSTAPAQRSWMRGAPAVTRPITAAR